MPLGAGEGASGGAAPRFFAGVRPARGLLLGIESNSVEGSWGEGRAGRRRASCWQAMQPCERHDPGLKG